MFMNTNVSIGIRFAHVLLRCRCIVIKVQRIAMFLSNFTVVR